MANGNDGSGRAPVAIVRPTTTVTSGVGVTQSGVVLREGDGRLDRREALRVGALLCLLALARHVRPRPRRSLLLRENGPHRAGGGGL